MSVLYYDQKKTSKRVVELRKANGITQEMMAEHLGISIDHYARMERCERYWSLEVMAEIGVFLNTSMDYLVYGKKQTPDEVKESLRASFEAFLESI